MKREIKIGIFLTIALGITAAFIFVVGDLGTLFEKPGYEVFIYFDSATGLEKRTGVRLAGVKVGYIKDIRLKDNQAEVVLRIEQEVEFRTDSRATLAALGLLGEKYIEIIPGTSGPICLPGGSIEVVPAIGLEELGGELADVSGEIQETSRVLRELLGSPDSRTNLTLILENMAAFASDLREFSRENSSAVNEGIQKGSRAIDNFDARVESLASSLDELVVLLRDVVAENRESVRHNLENIAVLLEKADRSLTTLDQTLDKVNKGEGTLGRLIQEEGLYEDAQQAVDDVQRAVQPVSKFRAGGALQFNYYTDPEEIKSYLTLSFWPAADKFLLGQVIQDPFLDEFTYSLQGGMRWGNVQARAGVMESKIGGAMDFYAFRDRVRISVELFDLNRDVFPHFRIQGSYSPVRYISLLFGLDDFGLKERRELFFGLGLVI
jgi:ABC-type transporter Mla subunit MlaD